MKTVVVTRGDTSKTVVVTRGDTSKTVVVTRGMPGPPGPPGPPGSGGTSGALLIDNRLNEYAADPVAQEQARNNLGITPSTEAPEYIDGGSF